MIKNVSRSMARRRGETTSSSRRRMGLALGAILVAGTVTACGGDDDAEPAAEEPAAEEPAAEEPAAEEPAAEEPAAEEPAAEEPAAEEPADGATETTAADVTNCETGETTTIKLGVPFVSTLNSALWYTEGMGIFEEYGIEIETVEIEGGRASAAMLGGSIDMTITSSNNSLAALNAGQEFTIIAATGNGFPQQVIINKDDWNESGLAEDASFQEKMEWLDGQGWGVSSPTGSSATLAQYLYTLAGLDPENSNLVSLGGTSGVLAGVKSGQVVVGSAGSPNPEVAVSDGYAEFFIDVTGGEVPEITDITSSVLEVTPDFYEENTDLVGCFREALAAGQTEFASDPETSMDFVAKEYFGTSPYDAVIEGMQNQLAGGSIATSPVVDHDSAQKMVDFMLAIGEPVPDDWERIFIDLR